MFKIAKPLTLLVETPLHAGSGSELGIVDLPIQREKHTNYPKVEASGLKGCLREAFENQCQKLPVKLTKEFQRFDQARFKVTERVVKELRNKKIPAEILDKLDNVTNKEYQAKEQLISALETAIGKEETQRHQLKIVEAARNAVYLEEGIFPAFGPPEGELHASALGFTDVRLLLFPVKSMKGVFAWITCPAVLQRFKRDLELTKTNPQKFPPVVLPEEININEPNIERKVPETSTLFMNTKVILEEYAFEVKKDPNCTKLAAWLADHIIPSHSPDLHYWHEKMKKDIVVLNNDDFRDFVTVSTEVIARTRINDDTGTVQEGALWYEEYLPADSVLYSLILASPLFTNNTQILKTEQNVMTFFEKGLPPVIQIGGNATIGKGIVRTQILHQKGGK